MGEVELASFLLSVLNATGHAHYVARCGLPSPTADVAAWLTAVARRHGALRDGGAPDLDASARLVLAQYRRGEFGRLTLDDLTPAAVDAFFQQRRERARPPPPP